MVVVRSCAAALTLGVQTPAAARHCGQSPRRCEQPRPGSRRRSAVAQAPDGSREGSAEAQRGADGGSGRQRSGEPGCELKHAAH